MADTDQQVVLLGENSPAQTQCISENGGIITVTQGGEMVTTGVGEDILQQALDEASEGYENADVEYTTEAESITVVADSNGTLSDANGVTYSYVTTNMPSVSDNETVTSANQVQPGQSLIRVGAASAPRTQVSVAPQTEVVTIPTTGAVSNVLAVNSETAQNQGVQVQQQIVQPQMVRIIQPQVIGQEVVQQPQQIVQEQSQSTHQVLPQQTHVQLSQSASGTPGAITVLTNSGAGSEPLGSSGNPIRIIQQGNKYTSVQQLTAEQVAQIMQVVQQQQLAQSTSQGGGSSVLFNSQTQTRIVYRVIYPAELHSKTGNSASASVTASAQGPKTITVPRQMVTIGGPKRTYKKRNRDEEEKIDGPELSKEEKETKKKHRPRTRSGRVSRPPKHMVQDYKHIHHLDWEEDYDDSDGGYSDYHVSDNEEGELEEKGKEATYVGTALGSSKPKNHNCQKCDKAYIGAAGLARHYRLNPDHGNPEDVLPSLSSATANGLDAILNSGDDSSTQDSFTSTASVPNTTNPPTPVITSTSPSPSMVTTSPAKPTPRGAVKSKQVYAQDNTPARRKARLKDLVRQCKNEELMEVVLPRLARVITLWEFLLMKVEKGRPSRPHIADVLNEYEALNKQVSKMCNDYLVPMDESGRTTIEKHRNILQMTNQAIAEALGLNMGKYVIHDSPKLPDTPLTYKIVTSTSDTETMQAGGTKRKVQMVTPEEFMQLTKRQCLTEPCITSVTQASGVVTLSMGNKLVSTTSSPSTNVKLKQALASGSADVEQNLSKEGMDCIPGGITSEVVNAEDISEDAVNDNRTINVPNEEGTDSSLQHKGDGIRETQIVLQTQERERLEERDKIENHTARIETQVICDNNEGHANGEEVINSIGSEFTHSEAVIESSGIDQDMTTKVIMTKAVRSVPLESVGVEQSEVQMEQEPSTEVVSELHQEGVHGAQSDMDQVSESVVVEEGQTIEGSAEAIHMEPTEQVLQGSTDVQNSEVILTEQTQAQEQQLVTNDGPTVLFTSDGGQTYYQQNLHIEPTEMTTQEEAQQSQEQEIPIEATSQQLVSMETPDGLVEGQLVTNEDGTQFLIHQHPTEQQVYQTPDGLILIQNPDGTLRIHNNGDQQIPLETVQALLAVDVEGQVQVEGSCIEQST